MALHQDHFEAIVDFAEDCGMSTSEAIDFTEAWEENSNILDSEEDIIADYLIENGEMDPNIWDDGDFERFLSDYINNKVITEV